MIKFCDCKTRPFQDERRDVGLFVPDKIDDQQDQGEDAEEEEDTRHVHDAGADLGGVHVHPPWNLNLNIHSLLKAPLL